MNGEQTFNLNQAECIKSWTDFGMDHYQNICSGKVWDVPWGSADWALALFVCGFGIFVLLMILGFIAAVVRESF